MRELSIIRNTWKLSGKLVYSIVCHLAQESNLVRGHTGECSQHFTSYDLTIASIKCFIRPCQCLNSKNSIATVFPQGKQRDYSIIHSGESVIAKHKNGRYANLIDKFVYHKILKISTSIYKPSNS